MAIRAAAGMERTLSPEVAAGAASGGGGSGGASGGRTEPPSHASVLARCALPDQPERHRCLPATGGWPEHRHLPAGAGPGLPHHSGVAGPQGRQDHHHVHP